MRARGSKREDRVIEGQRTKDRERNTVVLTGGREVAKIQATARMGATFFWTTKEAAT